MSSRQRYAKLELPAEVFRYDDGETQLANEEKTMTPVEKLEWNKGIFLYLQGAEYPQKGMASVETMWALNRAKRTFIESLRFLGRWYSVPSLLFVAILPWRYKLKVIEHAVNFYCELTWKLVNPFVLKNEYMTPVAQELEWATYSFLDNLGVKPELASKFSEVFASIIEYDNAYRYRMEDLFSETTKAALLKDPVKEMERLSEILIKRDNSETVKKMRVFVKILRLALLQRQVRNALRVVVSEIDVRKMGLDEIDRYWVCLRKYDYDYMGLSDDKREYLIRNKKKPTLLRR